jgi:hypothetical protein
MTEDDFEALCDKVFEAVDGQRAFDANMALISVLFGDLQNDDELNALMDMICDIANDMEFEKERVLQ